MGNWCGLLYKSISKHSACIQKIFAYSLRSKTTACVCKKPSVCLVLGKVGDLSSRGYKIQILCPCTTGQHPRLSGKIIPSGMCPLQEERELLCSLKGKPCRGTLHQEALVVFDSAEESVSLHPTQILGMNVHCSFAFFLHSLG